MSTAFTVRAGIRLIAAWKVAWRAASNAAWNAASVVSQRRSVFSPMPQAAVAFPIDGSDKSATIACSRTASGLAPWPVRGFPVICAHLRSSGRCGPFGWFHM